MMDTKRPAAERVKVAHKARTISVTLPETEIAKATMKYARAWLPEVLAFMICAITVVSLTVIGVGIARALWMFVGLPW
jgi:hypothetical protein